MTNSSYINQLLRLRISFDFQLLMVLFFYGIIKGIEYSLGISFGLLTFAFFGIAVFYLFTKALLSPDDTVKAKGLLFVAFVGNDYYFFLIGLVIFIYTFVLKRNVKVTKFNIVIFAFLVYAVILTTINLIYEFFATNFILSFLLYSSFITIPFLFSNGKFSTSEMTKVVKFFESLIVLQIGLILIQAIFDFTFKPGDWGRGSLDSTDRAGFFIFLYFLVNIVIRALVEREGVSKTLLKRPLYVAFMFLLIILLDAKLIYLSILVSLMLLLIIIVWFLKNFAKRINLRSLLLFTVSIVIFVLVIPYVAEFYSSRILKERRSIISSTEKYFDDPDYSQKYILYKRTFYEMSKDHPFFSVFGVGMGKFGGKVSNAFAKDVLYKDPDNAILTYLPTLSSQWVKKYYEGLYTKEVYDTIRWRSANFSFPFAGLITIKVELGFVGLFFFLVILYSMAMKSLKKYFQITDLYLRRWLIGFSIYLLTIPILMLFDNYQEFPQIMIPGFLFASLINNISVSE